MGGCNASKEEHEEVLPETPPATDESKYPETPLAKQAFFIVSKVSERVFDVDTQCGKLKRGEAKVGGGSTKDRLRGLYKEGEPLPGLCPVVSDNHLQLHDTGLYGPNGSLKWIEAFAHYANCVRIGCIILCKDLDGFRAWAASDACKREVQGVPNGRLFVFINDTIICVEADGSRSAATVKDGHGVSVWVSGATYDGQFKDDKKHGNGHTTFPNGQVHVGAYEDGQRHGHGRYTCPSGQTYEGEWRHDRRHGQGHLRLATGEAYDGSFQDGKRHGQGQNTWPSGRIYVGEFKDDKQHGNGQTTFPNGEVYVGAYEDGKRHGQGQNTWPSGAIYVGEYKDDKFNGHGRYNWPSGKVYDGQWKNNLGHGRGSLRLADGTTQAGKFANGLFRG